MLYYTNILYTYYAAYVFGTFEHEKVTLTIYAYLIIKYYYYLSTRVLLECVLRNICPSPSMLLR